MEQPRLLQLRDWQQIKQKQALANAGTPEGDDFLAESKRYGLAQDFIDQLQNEIGRLNELSQKESVKDQGR